MAVHERRFAFLRACRCAPSSRKRRCGSCARRAGRCPSTEPCGATATSWRRSPSPSSPPSSRCSPCAVTASTPPSCSPTSSCPWPRSGSGIEIVPGRGPVVDRAFPGPGDLDRLRPLEPEYRSRPRPRNGADRRRPSRGPPDRLRRGAVHPRQLSRRGRPVARPSPAPRPSCTPSRELWHELADRLADIALASLRAQVEAGAAAVQLFDSWAGALSPGRLRSFRPTAARARSSRASPTSASRGSISA